MTFLKKTIKNGLHALFLGALCLSSQLSNTTDISKGKPLALGLACGIIGFTAKRAYFESKKPSIPQKSIIKDKPSRPTKQVQPIANIYCLPVVMIAPPTIMPVRRPLTSYIVETYAHHYINSCRNSTLEVSTENYGSNLTIKAMARSLLAVSRSVLQTGNNAFGAVYSRVKNVYESYFNSEPEPDIMAALRDEQNRITALMQVYEPTTQVGQELDERTGKSSEEIVAEMRESIEAKL